MSLKSKMKRKEYESELRRLQGELVAMQEWVKASGAKICIVFEGLDSAGKGGTIRRITEGPGTRCWLQEIPPGRRGSWWTTTTRSGVGSI